MTMASTDPHAKVRPIGRFAGSPPAPDADTRRVPRRRFGAISGLLPILVFMLSACTGSTPPAAGSPTAEGSVGASEPSEGTAPDESTVAGGGVEGNLTPGTDLDACEIVTSDDIGSATKASGPVAAGTLEASPTVLSPSQTECTYEGDFGRIIVELTPEDGANEYDAARGAYKDASDITGIGDGAFNSDDNNRALIWKQKVVVMLTMFLNGGLEQRQVATDLGNAIIAKL
jgi:hypothetical protein